MTTKYQGPLSGNPKFHCETVTDGYYFEGTRNPDPRAKIGVAMVSDGQEIEIAQIDPAQISYVVSIDGVSTFAEHLNYALSLVRFCEYIVVGFGPLNENYIEVVKQFVAGKFRWGKVKEGVFFFTADEIRKCGGFESGEPIDEIYTRNRYAAPRFGREMKATQV